MLVVEVMGRHAGWIALNAGIAGGADVILIPEIPYDLGRVAEHLKLRTAGGRHALVVVAEGAHAAGGDVVVKGRAPRRAELLGGVGEQLARGLGGRPGCVTRTLSLGQLVRGGSPVAFDRVLGLMFGTAAVRALVEGHDGVMIAINPPRIDCVPLAEAVARMKRVPLDGEGVLTARSLGIALGD